MRKSTYAVNETYVMSRRSAVVLLFVAYCGLVQVTAAQSLDAKLNTVTDYVPKAVAPLDQLVEIAQKFKIPMAVEWLEPSETATPNKKPSGKSKSVQGLIKEIASVSSELTVEVADGLVRVYSPTIAAHPSNFLNVRLDSYFVDNDHLFAAEDQLRWAIRFTVNPARYRNGYGGGYGHGSPEVFEFPKFSLKATNITIRSVLDDIVKAQGNAMWLVTLNPEELDGRRPNWNEATLREQEAFLTTRWRFEPLADVSDLARERLAIDVTVDGIFDKRMTEIPLIMEHGLHGKDSDVTGWADDQGNSCFYGAHIEKMEREAVIISIELRVKLFGQTKRQFKNKLRVSNLEKVELLPFPGARIRAYFEPTEIAENHEQSKQNQR